MDPDSGSPQHPTPAGIDGEPFAVVGSRTVFAGKIATVRIDRVVMPAGAVVDREVVGHDKAVAVVALDDEDRVVLIEQYRHPLRRRLWELPAGLMDIATEPALTAVQRELIEETGLTADRWDLLVDLAPSPGYTDEAIRVFLARDLVQTTRPHPGDDEESELRIVRVPLADAVAAVLDHRIVNAAAVAGLLAAAAVRSSVSGAERTHPPAGEPWTTGQSLLRAPGESPHAPDLGPR